MRPVRIAARIAVALGAVLGGCLSAGDPPPAVRWFDPTPPPPEGAAAVPASAASPLRLQRVTAAPHLDRRFALRVGPREFAFDDQHRWTAEPELLVQHALEQALFSSGAFSRAEGHDAPAVEVHVAAFDLDLTGAPAARIELRVVLPGGAVHGLEVQEPSASRAPAELAEAMSAALRRACTELMQSLRG